MGVDHIYKGKYISIYLTGDKTIAFIDIYPHSMSLNLPADKLGEFLEDFAQASIYAELEEGT